MSDGRVITRPCQLDELRHGHRTALRSSADDSRETLVLTLLPTRKAGRPAVSEHTRVRRSTEDRTADQRLFVSGSNATVDTPVLELTGPAAGRPSRPRTAARRGCTSARRGTNRVPGPDKDQLHRWEFSPLLLPRQGDHPHGPLSVSVRTASSAAPGDKGNIADMSVIGYDPPEFEFIRQHVTCLRVREHFADIALGPVKRHEPPQLAVLKFVLPDALEGGVARTFNHDIHGKSLSSCLFELELPECPQRGQIDG